MHAAGIDDVGSVIDIDTVQDLQRATRILAERVGADLCEFLQAQGYRQLRRIGGVLCGLRGFNFTVGLVVGLSFESYERRYCYEHLDDARAALAQWDGIGHPPGPWIKCKGAGIDLLNPALRA